jgi:hypothetical protein
MLRACATLEDARRATPDGTADPEPAAAAAAGDRLDHA